jgi:hypothetical protein
MKKIILALFAVVVVSTTTTAQIKNFMNSTEFKAISKKISKLDGGIWTKSINDPTLIVEISQNKFEWASEDINNKLFLHNHFIIFTYHIWPANTSTLIYNRKNQRFKNYYFNAIELSGNNLTVTREGYKDGHWWQDGTLNLFTNQIVWSKNIDR